MTPHPAFAALTSALSRKGGGERGFTLLEVLVVVAIIALLAGIILPVLSKARAQGRVTSCKSNLSQLGKAVQMYAADNQSRYPDVASRPTMAPGKARLCDTLASYTKDPRLFKCASDNQAFFVNEGSSYEWNAVLNGKMQDSFIEQAVGSSRTPMMYDYENFHPDPGPGSFGGKNVVFCDGSVGN